MNRRMEIVVMLAASYTNRNGAPGKDAINKFFDSADNIIAEERRRAELEKPTKLENLADGRPNPEPLPEASNGR